jgi:hypothetical protein
MDAMELIIYLWSLLCKFSGGQSVHEVDYPYLDTSPKLICPTGKILYNSRAYVATPLPDYKCTEDKLKTIDSTYGGAVTSIYYSDNAQLGFLFF